MIDFRSSSGVVDDVGSRSASMTDDLSPKSISQRADELSPISNSQVSSESGSTFKCVKYDL